MSNLFRLHVLPAQRGDCIWIEYGDTASPRHILIDGGISKTGSEHLVARIQATGTPLHFELLVVTHIDLDHIQGIIYLLKNLPSAVSIGEIWFNGRAHLEGDRLQILGVREALELSDLISARHRGAWNKSADGTAIAVRADGSLPRYTLPGNMDVVVLSPNQVQLARLRDHWDEVVSEIGGTDVSSQQQESTPSGLELFGGFDVPSLAKTKFIEDNAVANGSSIALALEYDGRNALLLGDAYPSVVLNSLQHLSTNGIYRSEVVKVSHHGSRNNTDSQLVSAIDSPTWIFSSNGANNTKHPHLEAVARVLVHSVQPKKLVFNYRTPFNECWDDAGLMVMHGYDVVYGDGSSPVTVNI